MRKLILAAAALVPVAAFAGGYVVPNINARDLALGGAGGAPQDSAAAAYAHPAAPSRLERPNPSLRARPIAPPRTWTASHPFSNAGAGPTTPQTALPPPASPAHGPPP